jgi:hypothetical protein
MSASAYKHVSECVCVCEREREREYMCLYIHRRERERNNTTHRSAGFRVQGLGIRVRKRPWREKRGGCSVTIGRVSSSNNLGCSV